MRCRAAARYELESDDAGAVLEEGGREVAPGVEAKLLCYSGEAGEQQSNAAAAEQRRGEAEQRGARCSGAVRVPGGGAGL